MQLMTTMDIGYCSHTDKLYLMPSVQKYLAMHLKTFDSQTIAFCGQEKHTKQNVSLG